MSLPGVFPPVALGGGRHIDGGIADNAPFGRARKSGASRAFMIDCACATSCAKPPTGWTGIVGRAFEITLQRKHELELDLHCGEMEIFRIVPRLDISPGLLNFSSAQELISAGYEQTKAALADSLRPEAATRGQARWSAVPRHFGKVTA
jgi:NTE family protein